MIARVLAGVIYVSAVALAVLAVISFYITPHYEQGVRMAIETFKDVLLVTVGVKGGSLVPGTPEQEISKPKQEHPEN